MKPFFLRLHRWITLVFAIPLAIVIVTGLILSFEPIAFNPPGGARGVPLAVVERVLGQHDADRKARAINVRAYDNVVILLGDGPPRRVDLESGQLVPAEKRLWSDTFLTARRLHEHLLLDMKWLVDASTIAMLVSMAFGLLMGWPFMRNTLGGWHRTVAWGLLPLLIASPVTGLAIAYGWNLAGPLPRVEGPPMQLHDAVKAVAASHDLSRVIWIRPMAGAMRARLYDGGEAKIFAVTRTGLLPGPQNWLRAWHEGVFAGFWPGLMNVVVSLAFVLLMGTGLTIWARRTFRRRAPRAAHPA
jgi:uncharacterized iron-regulated membrane protein